MIIDEADTLFDESFANATISILKSIKIRNIKPANQLDIGEGAQVTIVGATLSSGMLRKIKALIPVSMLIYSEGIYGISVVYCLLIRTSRLSQAKDCTKSFLMWNRSLLNSDKTRKLVCYQSE